MILGIGTDAVDIWRLQRAIDRHGDRFLKRVFTPGEIEYCGTGKLSAQRYAARFAAKEAFVKALGTGFGRDIGMRNIEVVRNEQGKPDLELTGGAAETAEKQGVTSVHLSLSHSLKVAIAFVILEGGNQSDE